MSKPDPKFISQGIQWQCQGSGKCCVSHGEFGYVYLTLEDRKRFAKVLNLTTREFMQQHCVKEDGLWCLKPTQADGSGDCRFLKDKKCSVYEGRPEQCRTWPFWLEVMNSKSWKKDVATFCPGVGKGKVWSKEEIIAQIQQQKRSEKDLGV